MSVECCDICCGDAWVWDASKRPQRDKEMWPGTCSYCWGPRLVDSTQTPIPTFLLITGGVYDPLDRSCV